MGHTCKDLLLCWCEVVADWIHNWKTTMSIASLMYVPAGILWALGTYGTGRDSKCLRDLWLSLPLLWLLLSLFVVVVMVVRLSSSLLLGRRHCCAQEADANIA